MQPSQQDCNAHRAKATSNISLETEVLFMILCYLVLSVRMYYFLATFDNSSEDVSVLAHALLVSYDGVMYPNCLMIVVERCPFSCGQRV